MNVSGTFQILVGDESEIMGEEVYKRYIFDAFTLIH